MSPSDLVLDASAVVAWIAGEPGAERVARSRGRLLVSAVNLAEVATYLTDRKASAEDVRASLEVVLAQTQTVEFGEDDAISAGLLREPTRRASLSLADRACLALAARLGATALTADRRWIEAETGAKVELIR